MKRFKKAIKFSVIIILIILASVGIGLSGGVPVPPSGRKKDITEFKIEELEEKGDKQDKIKPVL